MSAEASITTKSSRKRRKRASDPLYKLSPYELPPVDLTLQYTDLRRRIDRLEALQGITQKKRRPRHVHSTMAISPDQFLQDGHDRLDKVEDAMGMPRFRKTRTCACCQSFLCPSIGCDHYFKQFRDLRNHIKSIGGQALSCHGERHATLLQVLNFSETLKEGGRPQEQFYKALGVETTLHAHDSLPSELSVAESSRIADTPSYDTHQPRSDIRISSEPSLATPAVQWDRTTKESASQQHNNIKSMESGSDRVQMSDHPIQISSESTTTPAVSDPAIAAMINFLSNSNYGAHVAAEATPSDLTDIISYNTNAVSMSTSSDVLKLPESFNTQTPVTTEAAAITLLGRQVAVVDIEDSAEAGASSQEYLGSKVLASDPYDGNGVGWLQLEPAWM